MPDPVNDTVSEPSEPSRADAVRNRDRILQAAHDAFAESGATSLNAVAKRAGVGAGTLYRHFPTREDLILAVYRRDVLELAASVPETLAAEAPLDAFRDWFRRFAAYIRVKQGLGEAMNSAAARDVAKETYAPLTAAIGALLRACEEEGSVRPGIDPADVLLLMGFLWRVGADAESEAQAARVMELAIGGLRP